MLDGVVVYRDSWFTHRQWFVKIDGVVTTLGYQSKREALEAADAIVETATNQ